MKVHLSTMKPYLVLPRIGRLRALAISRREMDRIIKIITGIKRSATVALLLIITIGLASCGSDSTSPLPAANQEPHVPSFDEHADYAAGDYPYALASSDFDGDGTDDIAVANKAGSFITILINDGNAVFQAAGQHSVGRWPESICTADLDGDNDSDLVTANNHGNSISVLLNNGDGTFQPAVDYEGVRDGVIGTSGGAVIASDLDGDMDYDLACTNMHSGVISIFMNNGDGTFSDSVQHNAGNRPVSLCSSDLDADSDSDLIVANRYSNDLSVLVNNGDGTFEAAVSYGADLWQLLFVQLGSIVSCDLDGDSDKDVVVAGDDGMNALIMLNNGDGTLSDAVIYCGTSEGNSSLFASDLDNDGDYDLAVTNESSGNVSVLLNNGNAIFEVNESYPVGTRPLSVITNDFDGDGDKDLAVVNLSSDDISVLINSLHD
jgi:hypothetical protein